MRGLFLTIGTILTVLNLTTLALWLQARDGRMIAVSAFGLACASLIVVMWV